MQIDIHYTFMFIRIKACFDAIKRLNIKNERLTGSEYIVYYVSHKYIYTLIVVLELAGMMHLLL